MSEHEGEGDQDSSNDAAGEEPACFGEFGRHAERDDEKAGAADAGYRNGADVDLGAPIHLTRILQPTKIGIRKLGNRVIG